MNSPCLPHTTRPLSGRHPVHVVLTLVREAPPVHRRRVREIFLRWIEETRRRYSLVFNLGTWMTDHVHLIVEAPRPRDLSLGLKFLCSKVALEVNRAFDRKGPLFADRFFSRILGTPSELIRALVYVAKNPVRAGYVTRPEDWRAGSVRDFIRGSKTPSVWQFRGYFFHLLGFTRDPREALLDILSGRKEPRLPSPGRQLRLPFVRGLPTL